MIIVIFFNFYVNTVLFVAAQNGQIDIVQLLLSSSNLDIDINNTNVLIFFSFLIKFLIIFYSLYYKFIFFNKI